MKELAGRIAVVTGAASGIGLGATERFLAEGMKVVLADVEQPRLEAETQRLAAAGGEVLGVHCDVRDPLAVESLAEQTLSHFGAVHVAFNNAGVVPVGPLLDTTPADWRWVVDVNVLGVAYGSVTFGRIMREAGEGHIVNTASESGLSTLPSFGMYAATKHAVVGLSESLQRELAGTGVGVSCLCPGIVKTRFFESERNRDDGVELTAEQLARAAPLRERVAAHGIGPDQVAGYVVEAIRNDRFWIFTHEATPRRAALRHDDIAAGRNPTDPHATAG
jgi:NAD(P)-dependent dehydrogenase (short-subunit alcohol dehydrogenase family)